MYDFLLYWFILITVICLKVSNKIADGVYLASVLNRRCRPSLPRLLDSIDTDQVESRIERLRREAGTAYESSSTNRVTLGGPAAVDDAQRLINQLNEFQINVLGIESIDEVSFLWLWPTCISDSNFLKKM